MKKNLIALLLAVVMTAGSVGTVPAYAAETITEENAAEGATEPTAEETEEESTEDTDLNTDESEDTELEVESDTEVKEETEQASVESTEEGTTVDSTTEETISTDSEEVAMEEEETEASFDTSEEMAEIVEPEAVAEEVIEADNEEDSDAAITNEVLITGSSTQKASASRTIEVTAGKYYWYTYATTYGNLSFNADSNSYCSFVYGGYSSNAGYYYYTLHFYPKAGGKNTIIEVYDNNTGKNIDLLIVHSSDQEGEAQSICRGKSIEVEFETIDEISEGNVMVASVGSDSTISYVLNSFTFESILLHGSSVPRTYLYKANITLNTS